MSRIGNKPIEIPEKVETNSDGNKINVKGPKGELVTEVLEEKIKFEISDNVLQLTRESDEKQVKSKRVGMENNIIAITIETNEPAIILIAIMKYLVKNPLKNDPLK